MRMPRSLPASLLDNLDACTSPGDRFLCGREATISVSALRDATTLGGRMSELVNRSVLVVTRDQLATALALVELDGLVSRLVLCPSDVAPAHLPGVIADAGIEAIVSDRAELLNGD